MTFPPVTTPLVPANTGLYFDIYGQGIDLQVKDRTLLHWYTWDETESIPRYYWGESDQAHIEFSMFTTSGGTFHNPTSRKVIPAGKARVYMDGDHCVLNYNTPEHGRGSFRMRPIAHSQHPLNGAWYDPAYDGSGFSLQVFGNQMVAYWYTYGDGSTDDPFPTKKNRSQRWFICQGEAGGAELNGDTVSLLTIYELYGGRFGRFDVTEIDAVGTLILSEEFLGGMFATYAIDAGDGVKGSGQLNLERSF